MSTQLHDAAYAGKADLVKLLLAGGTDANVKDELGRTPLHRAAIKGHLEVARLLLSAGAQINARDQYGLTPLAFALGLEIIEQSDTWTGSTKLTEAQFASNKSFAKFLIANGANVNAADIDGNPILTLVREPDVMEFLLANGANPSGRSKFGSTSLHWLADFSGGSASARLKRIDLLLKKGADVNAVDHRGKTPLNCAAGCCDREFVKLLIDRGADVNKADCDGWTPLLSLAAGSVMPDYGPEVVAGLLLARGADINARNSKGQTALHLAAFGSKKALLALLIHNHASVNARNNFGKTPLGVATTLDKGIAELLRQHGATL